MHVIEAAKILPCNTLHALLQRVAEQAPDAPAILGVQRSPLSHSALLRHVENTVLALNTFGISRGDRVAMLLPNGSRRPPHAFWRARRQQPARLSILLIPLPN